MTKLIKHTLLVLFFLLPLSFTMTNSELFEFPKIILIYVFTSLLLTIHLINFFNGHTPLFAKGRLNLPLLLFLISQVVSTVISVDRHMSIFGYYSRFNGGLLSTICFIILFQIVQIYTDKIFTQKVINISILSSVFVSFYAIAQHFGIDKHLWVQDVQARVFSTLGQPNWLAAYLCIIISFVLYKLDTNPSFTHYLLLVTNFLSLIFTKSKSGFIASAIPLSYYFFSHLKSFKKNISFLLVILFPLIVFSNPVKDRLFPQKQHLSSPTDTLKEAYNITSSADIRKIVWQGALDLWKKFPLFGTGVETFAISYYWVRPADHNLTSEWDFIYNKAHNEYLNFAATTGTFGLLSYLLVIGTSVYLLKNEPYFLVAYLTILVTNFVGFSVVVTSLYFMVLPALANPSEISSSSTKPKPYFSLLLVPLILYALIYFISYFLADKNYFLSHQFQDQYPKAALEKINISLKLRPKEPDYLLQAADILANLDQTDLAINYLAKAEQVSPTHPNFLKKSAQILFNLGQYQTAIALINKVTLLCPTDAKAFYILGYFYQTTGNMDKAISAYQQAIDLKPNYDHAHFYLAKLYFDQGHFDQALLHFQTALDINPKNSDAKSYIDKIISRK